MQFDSQEDERLLQASERFERDAAQGYPDRACISTVIDLNGKTVFITRYIRPLNPPQELLDAFPNNPQEATVSLITTQTQREWKRLLIFFSSHCLYFWYDCIYWTDTFSLSPCRLWLLDLSHSSLLCQIEFHFLVFVTCGAPAMWVNPFWYIVRRGKCQTDLVPSHQILLAIPHPPSRRWRRTRCTVVQLLLVYGQESLAYYWHCYTRGGWHLFLKPEHVPDRYMRHYNTPAWSRGLGSTELFNLFISQGPTAYVLTFEQSRYLIWNPSSGQYYGQYDTFCPLQTVGCLVNADNVSEEKATAMWHFVHFLE